MKTPLLLDFLAFLFTYTGFDAKRGTWTTAIEVIVGGSRILAPEELHEGRDIGGFRLTMVMRMCRAIGRARPTTVPKSKP